MTLGWSTPQVEQLWITIAKLLDCHREIKNRISQIRELRASVQELPCNLLCDREVAAFLKGETSAINDFYEADLKLAKVELLEKENSNDLRRTLHFVACLMTDEDFRLVPLLPDAKFYLSSMPFEPDGRVFEITRPFSLETTAFHANRYWEPGGCRYTFAGHVQGEEVLVRVAGSARVLLTWFMEEFEDNESVLESFQKCEDEDLVEAYHRQHRMTNVPSEGGTS